MKYQVMPALSREEYDALKLDIRDHGVLVPVEYDEEGNILDGHNRVKACHELGITKWPKVVRRGLSETSKLAHARRLNLNRRHLTRKQRAAIWVEMRKAGKSYRQIAEEDGTASDTTVMRAIEATASNEAVDFPATVTGKDGKKRQAKKPQPAGPTDEEMEAGLKDSVKAYIETEHALAEARRDLDEKSKVRNLWRDEVMELEIAAKRMKTLPPCPDDFRKKVSDAIRDIADLMNRKGA